MQKSILITGCSSGIGYAAAKTLKEHGYRVFAAARKLPDVECLQTEGFEAVQLDVDSDNSIQAAINTILQKTNGTLDALFNNAGFLQPGAVEDITREMDHAQFETNVFGAMALTRRVLPIMRKQGHGRIIQNCSILSVVTVTYCGSYNASKFALEGYSSTLRQELRGTNIHVSIINPGPIYSALRENAFELYREHIEVKQTGLHRDKYEKMKSTYFKPSKQDQKVTSQPNAVVDKLIHALESKHPKAHYYVGMPAHVLALCRRILPDCMLDWVLSKMR